MDVTHSNPPTTFGFCPFPAILHFYRVGNSKTYCVKRSNEKFEPTTAVFLPTSHSPVPNCPFWDTSPILFYRMNSFSSLSQFGLPPLQRTWVCCWLTLPDVLSICYRNLEQKGPKRTLLMLAYCTITIRYR